jgi:hypothetical protein
VSNERSFRLLIVAGVVCGALVTTNCGNKMTILVQDSGKPPPSPKDGDTLTFVDQKNIPRRVKWVGPPSTGISPCTEQQPPNTEDTPSDTCTVKYTTKKIKMYHYICVDPSGGTAPGCTDPSVPGPRSSGGPIDPGRANCRWQCLYWSSRTERPVKWRLVLPARRHGRWF